jgi:hypothetical protein
MNKAMQETKSTIVKLLNSVFRGIPFTKWPSIDCKPIRPHSSGMPSFTALIMVFTTTILASIGCKSKTEKLPPSSPHYQNLTNAVATFAATLKKTEHLTTELASKTSAIYQDLESNASLVDATQYKLESNGVLHRPCAIEENVPAVFVSGAVKITDDIIKTVKATEALDPWLRELTERDPTINQAYFNSKDSYNRIYPPFEVLSQYPAGMEIPAYNFYYLADQKHNPERVAIWVKEPYVDPAGRGWMITCSAPVYVNGILEGVCGLDLTVESIVRHMNLDDEGNRLMLISSDGTVVAAGEALLQILRLPILKNHRYVDTVRADTFRPSDYNLLKSRSREIRTAAENLLVLKSDSVELSLDQKRWHIDSIAIPQLDWLVLQFRIK